MHAKDPKRSLVARTLWRIETGLASAPSLEDLARAEGVSRFHMTRAFGLTAGQPLMAYVRARRLTEAARRLAGGADTVISVALDAGYESHEGFTRAFRDHFGIPPSRVKTAIRSHPSFQEPVTMPATPMPPQEPRIVRFDGLSLVGRSQHFTTETRGKIPGHWDACVEAFGDALRGRETFGVCHDFDDHVFDYLVGSVDDGKEIEGRPDRLRLPAGRYAVFRHAGHISAISDTWSAIFDDWLPKAGLTPHRRA